jgi:hypothetical protein
VIQFIDLLEENKDLEIQEWNFRDILKQHLSKLLQWQITYWKQRGTLKWVTSGDARTKFFHANATVRHGQNFISSLEGSNGSLITVHDEKTDML